MLAPKDPISLLFLCNSTLIGGAERYQAMVAAFLSSRGFRCIIAAPKGSEPARMFLDEGFEVLGLDIGPKLGMRSIFDLILWPIWLLKIWFFISTAKSEYGIAGIHLQFKKEQFLGSIAARMLGLPVLWTEHGPLPGLMGRPPASWVYRGASKLAHTIIAVSDTVRRDLEAKGCIDNVIVIYNGIDARRFGCPENLPGPHPKIGFVCRLSQNKGGEDFLRAAKVVSEVFPNARYLVVGDGPHRSRMEALAIELGISDLVEFTGFVNNIPTITKSLSIAVSASYSQGEGLPLRILEAMAASKPVVATDIGGSFEAVSNGVTGYLVPIHSHASIAAALISLLDHPEVAVEMGKNGREIVMEKFDIDVMMGQTFDVVRSMLNLGART